MKNQNMAGEDSSHEQNPVRFCFFIYDELIVTIDTTLMTIHPFYTFLLLAVNAILENKSLIRNFFYEETFFRFSSRNFCSVLQKRIRQKHF